MFEKLPNSTRKFIRLEKACIRRQFLDYKQQEVAIADMYSKILNKPIIKKSEETEPIKEGTSPKEQKNETAQKGTSSSQARAKTKNKKQKVHKNKKGKK